MKEQVSVNAQYNVARSGSLPIRIAEHQRRKMFQAFLNTMDPDGADTILDVGVTSDRSYNHSNYLELWYPHKSQVTACGLDDASFLELEYPGMRFVRADGRNLPFDDCSHDFVHSSAVLEHVGNRDNQIKFVSELWRVARRGIFVTTPNRWFPVEFHTLSPLIHWFPPSIFRAIMRRTGRAFFAREENLNLLGSRNVKDIAAAAGMTSPQVANVTIGMWPTNLLLVGHKS
ncbi:MAG: methyltransferase domain-containing protein [Burkholderiales bacterium]